jgi:hypothetical protein
MSGLFLLAIGCAVLWLASFVMLYRAASRQQDLQQQLDAFEQSIDQ